MAFNGLGRILQPVSILVLAFCMMVYALPAWSDFMEKPSDSVDVGFVFMKLTGQTPDYEALVKQSDIYKKAKDFDKPVIHDQMMAEMENSFNATNPDDFLVVRSTVDLGNHSDLQKSFFIDNLNADTFFAYDFAGLKIALVLPEIEQYSQLQMTEDEYKRALSSITIFGKGIVEIMVKPVRVDSESTMEMNGTSYWLMHGKIAEIRFFNDNGDKIIWYHRADWYQGASAADNLFRE